MLHEQRIFSGVTGLSSGQLKEDKTGRNEDILITWMTKGIKKDCLIDTGKIELASFSTSLRY